MRTLPVSIAIGSGNEHDSKRLSELVNRFRNKPNYSHLTDS